MSDWEKENKALWDISIPGRDYRENELENVPDILKENLSAEGVDKYMHFGVLAYAASSYLVDVLREFYYIDDEDKKTELQKTCIERIVRDLILGAEADEVNAFDEEDEYVNSMVEWIRYVFEEAQKKI